VSVFACPPLAAASGRCRNAQLPSVEMGPPVPVREVERFGQSLPEGPYGRRNRQAIAARETRVTTRLVAAALSRPRWDGDARQPVVQGRSFSGLSITQMCLIRLPAKSKATTATVMPFC
jgi:hypothetical protein